MNESIHGERTASEPQDRVSELIEQQTAMSEMLRAIASSPHDLQPIFDSATRLCRADICSLPLSEESGLRRVAMRGDPLLVSQVWSLTPVLAENRSHLSRIATSRLPTHIPDFAVVEADLRDDFWKAIVKTGFRTSLFVPLLKDNEIVGIITLGRKQVQPFTDKQISFRHKRGGRHAEQPAADGRQNNQPLGINQDNYVWASQLAQTTYQSGSGADTLWVRVSDGALWSAWSQSFTVTAPIDTGPVVVPTSTNVSASHNQSFAVSTLFLASDPFGDPITEYDFWDSEIGGGRLPVNGQAIAANQDDYVSAAQLPEVTYQSGSGSDTLWVRVSDGDQWSPWAQSFTVTAPFDPGPLATPIRTTVGAAHNQTFAASNLFTANDPFGDAITAYDFWNAGAGGGRFIVNGQPLGTNEDNYVSAAQLAQITYHSGSGADTLWVRVSDGSEWSPWSRASRHRAGRYRSCGELGHEHPDCGGQTFAACALFTTSDPFSDAIERFDFWDAGAGGQYAPSMVSRLEQTRTTSFRHRNSVNGLCAGWPWTLVVARE